MFENADTKIVMQYLSKSYVLQQKNAVKKSRRKYIAGLEGFEPPNAGIRIQCLTAWRKPNAFALQQLAVLYNTTWSVSMELCEFKKLKITRFTKNGAYLSCDKDEEVLLPGKEVPEGAKAGDEMDVFLYLDSLDRPVATVKKPLITKEAPAVLEVTEITPIGVFLDWGLDKDLLLPFREQVEPVAYGPGGVVQEHIGMGDKLPVYLYIDKSGRPAASMRIYNRLENGTEYVKDSAVEGTVIRINPEMGVFVAVDDKYFGMIPIREIHHRVALGDKVYGRVTLVRDDGKYMISLNNKAHIQMDQDAQLILDALEAMGGRLPLGDKSDPEDIKKRLHMSKAAFKRAAGSLYKQKKIIIGAEEIRLNITEI